MEASALSAPAALGRRSVSAPLLRLRSDEQLVALFRAGNEDAFRVIHDRYRQRLFAYARQMLGGSRADAEDALQDVFLRAYRALRVDERPVSLRAWLYRVAHNRCIDHLRRPVPPAADVYDLSRTPLQDPLEVAERREDLARLVADVGRLPEHQRSALLMRELDGLSYAELAAALDTSVPAIKSLLVRARIGLVEAIEARDADCADIRHDLAGAFDRGVRANGRARRHLRDCPPCARYKSQLAEVRRGFAALTPALPAPHLLAKLLGIGGAGSGAAAGGAAAGGGGAAIGGTAAAVSVGKVAALVCCAAMVTGGAVQEVTQLATPAAGHQAAHSAEPTTSGASGAMHRSTPGGAETRAAATASSSSSHLAGAVHRHAHAGAADEGITAPLDAPVWSPRPATSPADPSGGAVAPDEAGSASAPAPATSDDASPGLIGTLLGHGGSGPGTASSSSAATAGSSSGSGASSGSTATSTQSSTSTGTSSGPSTGSSSSSSTSSAGSGPTASSASTQPSTSASPAPPAS